MKRQEPDFKQKFTALLRAYNAMVPLVDISMDLIAEFRCTPDPTTIQQLRDYDMALQEAGEAVVEWSTIVDRGQDLLDLTHETIKQKGKDDD